MELRELIGKKIIDILLHIEMEPYGLDKADSFLILENGLVVGIPFAYDDKEVWQKEPHPEAKSIFKPKRWWQKPDPLLLRLKNTIITDIISYKDELMTAFIQLDNGMLITEINIAPSGTGDAAFWYYDSIAIVEDKFGKKYKRLTDSL